jgi:hypothetical protein
VTGHSGSSSGGSAGIGHVSGSLQKSGQSTTAGYGAEHKH